MKAVLWITCWSCYYIGDLCGKMLDLCVGEVWIYFWYSIYNKFMLWSAKAQNAAGLNPRVVNESNRWVWQKSKTTLEEK